MQVRTNAGVNRSIMNEGAVFQILDEEGRQRAALPELAERLLLSGNPALPPGN